VILKIFFSSKNKILDVGCGMGHISNWVAFESNADVFGVDISSSVDEAHKIYNLNSKGNLQFVQADLS
jgi:2-polyprenyl-3-methyl-5-hydroxy-6-metoxy-1,4-benzoquinol methylase